MKQVDTIAKEKFGKAIVLLRKKQYFPALEHFEKCLEHEYRINDVYFYLGRLHYQLFDYIGSAHYYSLLLENQPSNAGAYNNRAISKVAIGEFTNAIDDYNKAIEHDPSDPVYYANRGLAWLNMDSPNNALSDFNKSLGLDPTYSRAYLFRGNIHNKHLKFQEALKDFSKAIENAPDFYDAYLQRGKILTYLGDVEYGMHHIRYGSELEFYKYWQKEKKEDLFKEYPFRYDRAVSDFTRAIELRPKDHTAYILRASVNLKISLYNGIANGPDKLHLLARQDALTAIELSDGEEGFYVLAASEARLCNEALAMKHLEMALDYGEEYLDVVFKDKSWEMLLDDLEFSAIIDNYINEDDLFDSFGAED